MNDRIEYDIEKIAKSILATQPNIVFIYDMEEKRNKYSNKEIEKRLGYTQDEIRDMGPALFKELIHPDDLERVRKFQDEVKEAKDEQRLEVRYRMRTRSGQWKWFASWESVFSRNEDGSVKEKLGIAVDITDMKMEEERKLKKFQEKTLDSLMEAQEKLKESEERYQLATHAANTGIWDWNVRENKVWYSDRWKEMLGYQPDEIKNEFSSWEELLHPDDRDRMVKAVQDYLEDPEGYFEAEFRLRCRDGSYKWIFNRADRILGEDGKPVRMFGSHFDITDPKDQQMRIEDLNRSLRLINKILRHDLSNYIHLISGTLSLYKIKKDDSSIERAEFYLKRCYDVIENMRYLESAVTGNGEKEIINVAEVLRNESKKYPIDIEVNGNCQIEMIPQSFNTVVSNIVNNAINHGETDRMVIDIVQNNGSCEIRFRDFGEGVPDEFKDIVFKEGFSYGIKKSTGLGLFIVKKLVERSGWNICVEDNEPRGAVFVMKSVSC